ncbi:hypothetical protein PIB30_029557 [Stylosanthes scabra]|uniref:Uncharacterized protein n=1 Tax=Stylosanthes scabra TaxID=79078 RepID=A0ABU6WB25_9FABA|nr:hypothetical protein [Stylosanthes scabra]
MAEVVSSVARTLLANLATSSFQEIVLACGLNDDVKDLQSSLKIISAYLLDAENKQAKNHSVAEWLKQLREAFDDAGDILDEIEYEANHNEVVKMYGSISTKVKRFFSYKSNPLTFRIRMVHKIRDMKQKIDEKTKEGRNMGIVEQHVNTPTLEHNLPWRETSSSLPLRVCGRHQEKEKIIKLLMGQQSEANNVDVISIVGIGGLGKTTLAQMVYDDDRVKQHFNMLMWVCVSDDFDVKMLIQKIIHAASRTENVVNANSSLEHMVSLLNEKLCGKKFFLVLDDIWNENHNKWDEFRNHLFKASSDRESKGSKIIVTTRSHKVADIVGGGLIINLEALPEDECWKLFLKCAFQEEREEDKYPRLKQIGVEIVKKCKGLPLAITTLGCFLRSKSHDENEWRKISDSEVWELDQEEADILPSLRLSYNHLPPEVKQCFSYCSYFPKDYNYQAIELIMFWMAHGLLQPTSEEEDAEDIGELYIKKLVSTSLLQLFGLPFMNFTNSITFKFFKMHDLVHDLAKSTMKESNKTRTIVQMGQQEASMEWFSNKKFDYLKVLHLEKDMELTSLSDDCFAPMKKHLRYLHLENHSLQNLPDSFFKLQYLQILKLFGFRLQELPNDMINLINLQYLFLKVEAKSLSSMNIGHFQQLKFLYLGWCSELVSIPSVVGCMTTLKKLKIHFCSNLVNFKDGEEGGKQHNSNLQLFEISCSSKLKALPKWLERATKLRYLKIEDTRVKSLPTRLPIASLEELHIIKCKELSFLPNNIDQAHHLQYLEILRCPTLSARYKRSRGPDWPKIAHIPHCKIDLDDQNSISRYGVNKI